MGRQEAPCETGGQKRPAYTPFPADCSKQNMTIIFCSCDGWRCFMSDTLEPFNSAENVVLVFAPPIASLRGLTPAKTSTLTLDCAYG